MWLCSPLAREQAGEQRAAHLHPACAGPAPPAARCPPLPALSFFLPRPFGVFGVCIFSAFSTSATELTPESVFFSRSVLESPWREEEGCAHKCGGRGHTPSSVSSAGKPHAWAHAAWQPRPPQMLT